MAEPNPNPKNLLTRDLFELPGLRQLRRSWFLTLTRGERGNATRTLLFLDLAEAVRLNTPLDQALELMAEGHDRVELPFIISLNVLFDTDLSRSDLRVKLLAWHLLPLVRQGLSLSQAMARLGRVFSSQEVAIVEMGEKIGRLPLALKRLADYRQADMRLRRILDYLAYPVTMALLAAAIMAFLLVFIIPKYQDMYMQLGGELPLPTQILIQASRLLVDHAPPFFFFCLIGLLLYYLASSMINRATGIPPLYFLPVLRGLHGTVRNARWMAAFTLSLETGSPADRALEQAGAVSGGVLERRSREAAQLAGQGFSIGEACIRCRVLEPWINHRLQLIDWHGHYIEGVRGIVEDADRRVTENLERAGRRGEIFSVVAVGLIVALTVIAIYLPMFNIPKIVMAHY